MAVIQQSENLMKHLVRISSLSLMVFIISLFITIPVLAIPPLPSSFYGTVKVNDANVPDGTVIQALIGSQVYAEGFSQTYQGNSVYALDVRGDNTDTAAQDGAREGDTLQFKIGGTLADQTAVWHTATNVNLNLTASSSGSVVTPQATPTPVPTQTAIVLIQPSPMPATIGQASITPVTLVQPSQVAAQPTQPSQIVTQPAQPSQIVTNPSRPSPMPTKHVQPSLTSVAFENDQENGSGNSTQVVVIIITLVLALIIGYMFLTLRKKKM
jgi:hypothetical protein